MTDPTIRQSNVRPSGTIVWLWMTAVFFTLGAVWSLATPIMDGLDEPAHTIRAAGVWHGTINGSHQRVVTPQPDQGEGVVATGVITHMVVPRAYDELRTLPNCYVADRHVTADCAPPVSNNTTPIQSNTYVGTYQPTYYLLVGWSSRLFHPALAIPVMRLVSVALGAALLGSGMLSAVRCARNRMVVLGAALAVTPMAMFIIGTINPSGLELAAAFATWLGLMELFRHDAPPDSATISRVTLAAVLFGLTRPLSPALVLLTIGLVAFTMAPPREHLLTLLRTRSIRIALVILGASLAFSSGWVLANHAYDAFTGLSQPGLTAFESARHHVSLLPFRARQLVGLFSNAEAPMPDAFIWIWLGAVGALVGAALRRGNARQRLGVLGALGATFAIPLVSEMSKAKDYGFIWQGRYSLPFAMGVPILAGWVLAQHPIRRGYWQRVPGIITAAVVGVTMVVSHLAFMTRMSIGYPNPLLDYLDEPSWNPPVPAVLLLALTLVAAGAYGLFITTMTSPKDVHGSHKET